MKDITVSDSILYIGADDRDIDLFESQYVVPNGVSYNSYVILDEKVAVMDTVDARRGKRGLRTWSRLWRAGRWTIWWCPIWSRIMGRMSRYWRSNTRR